MYASVRYSNFRDLLSPQSTTVSIDKDEPRAVSQSEQISYKKTIKMA